MSEAYRIVTTRLRQITMKAIKVDKPSSRLFEWKAEEIGFV